jgi:hypothetical protein
VRVKVGVQVGGGVGESSEGVGEVEGVNGSLVGEEVGGKLGGCVGVKVELEVEVAILLPSASESEKPPRSKPIEARAMRIPRNTCCKFFTASSLQAVLPRPASIH